MADTRELLDSFHDYALRQLAAAGPVPSIDELFEEWRTRYPTSQEFTASVAAVRVAIEDFENGDRGHPAGKLTQELRGRMGHEGA